MKKVSPLWKDLRVLLNYVMETFLQSKHTHTALHAAAVVGCMEIVFHWDGKYKAENDSKANFNDG